MKNVTEDMHLQSTSERFGNIHRAERVPFLSRAVTSAAKRRNETVFAA